MTNHHPTRPRWRLIALLTAAILMFGPRPSSDDGGSALGSLSGHLLVGHRLGNVLGPQLAYGDETDEDGVRQEALSSLAEGDEWMARGDRLRRRGRERRAARSYQRALESYQRAYKLLPRNGIFIAIARAEVRLNRHLDAIEHYRTALNEIDDRTVAREVQSEIARLKVYVAEVRFLVVPDGAEITIDNQLRGQSPLDSEIYLAPGEHLVTVTANGYTPYQSSLRVRAGEAKEHRIELSRVPILVKAPKPLPPVSGTPASDARAPRAPRASSGNVMRRQAGTASVSDEAMDTGPSRVGIITGVAATAVLAAAGASAGLLAWSRENTYRDTNNTPEIRNDARDSGRAWAIVADAAFGGALVVGLYTGYRYVFVYRRHAARRAVAKRGPPPPRAAMGPVAEPATAPQAAEQPWRDRVWLLPYTDGREAGVAVGIRF